MNSKTEMVNTGLRLPRQMLTELQGWAKVETKRSKGRAVKVSDIIRRAILDELTSLAELDAPSGQ